MHEDDDDYIPAWRLRGLDPPPYTRTQWLRRLSGLLVVLAVICGLAALVLP